MDFIYSRVDFYGHLLCSFVSVPPFRKIQHGQHVFPRWTGKPLFHSVLYRAARFLVSGFSDHPHPTPSSSIFIFSITLAQPFIVFNGQLHLMPGCLPTPLRSSWNCGLLEGGGRSRALTAPGPVSGGLGGPVLCVSLIWGRNQLRVPTKLPRSLQVLQPEGTPFVVMQPPTLQSAPCRWWLQYPRSLGKWLYLHL